MNSRMVHAEYAGEHYEIPEAWLIGFCHGPARYTVFDAIAFWHYQKRSEDRFNQQIASRLRTSKDSVDVEGVVQGGGTGGGAR